MPPTARRWTSNTSTTAATLSSIACASIGRRESGHEHPGAGIRHRGDRRRHRRADGGDQGQGTRPRTARAAGGQGQRQAQRRHQHGHGRAEQCHRPRPRHGRAVHPGNHRGQRRHRQPGGGLRLCQPQLRDPAATGSLGRQVRGRDRRLCGEEGPPHGRLRAADAGRARHQEGALPPTQACADPDCQPPGLHPPAHRCRGRGERRTRFRLPQRRLPCDPRQGGDPAAARRAAWACRPRAT